MKIISRLRCGMLLIVAVWIGCGSDVKKEKTHQERTPPISTQAVRKINPFKGEWVIHRFDPGFISAYSEDEAKSFVGKTLTMTDSTFHFENERISYDSVQIDTVETIPYFVNEGFKENPRKLGITEKLIQVVKLFSAEDLKRSLREVIVFEDEMMLVKNGAFFFLKKK